MVFLHQHRIIHRDLKSSNLLIANDRLKTVKICDFSMSRIQGYYQRTGAGLGTPGWVAPEETLGELVTEKADAFSFAMIMWELLTSTEPYAELLFQENIPESLQTMRMMEICTKVCACALPVLTYGLLLRMAAKGHVQWLKLVCAVALLFCCVLLLLLLLVFAFASESETCHPRSRDLV